MPKNNDFRKQKYKKLLDAGFSAKEASKLRDAKMDKIDTLINAKKEALYSAEVETYKSKKASSDEVRRLKYETARKAGFNSKDARVLSKLNIDKYKEALNSKVIPDRKIVGIQYQDISTSPKQYLSKYTYKVSFHRKERDHRGRWVAGETEYITITKMNKLTKREVLQIARNILLNSGVERYSPVEEIAITSLKIETAYENTDLEEV